MKIPRLAPLLALVAMPTFLFARHRPPVVKKEPVKPAVPMPDPAAVSALSAVILDAETGRVLWTKNGDAPMFPASTTKIMTALLLIEHCKSSDVITAPKDVKTVGESSMHLQPGEQLTMRNLLWAIMLRSANDGCYMAAMHIGGSVPGFAKLMNDRAAAIGCTHTHFANPNGLHDPKHWTSAHDLTLIAREAFKEPLFAETVRTPKHQIARSLNQKDTWMVSKNKLLTLDPTADGVKTGYTVPAGHTYVGSATRGGHRLITGIMKSDHWQLDDEAMMGWAFANYDHVTVARKGDTVGPVTVDGGSGNSVTGTLATDVTDCVPKGQASKLTGVFQPAKVSAPVSEGDAVGQEIYSDGTGYTIKIPVVAGAAVAKATPLAAVTGRSPSYFLIGSTLCLGLFWYRSRTRRSRFYGKTTRKGNYFPFS